MSDIRIEEELPFGLLSKNRALLGSNMVLKAWEAENSRRSAIPFHWCNALGCKSPRTMRGRLLATEGVKNEPSLLSLIQISETEY